MPELPEVETVCRGLAPVLETRCFRRITVRRGDLRRKVPHDLAQKLEGVRIEKVTRQAKYILIPFENGQTLLVHLGMSGRMVIDDGRAPLQKHDHVVFETDHGARIRFHDPRRFGMMDVVSTATLEKHKALRGLGVEPLGRAFTGAFLHENLRGRKTAIKIAIMDQALVVGVGNIYASEALFAASLHPATPAGNLSGRQCAALVAAIKNVLRRAIRKGGSSLRDYVQADGELGYFQHEFAVYGRAGEPCRGCTCSIRKTGGVKRIMQGGRASFFCPVRQKPRAR